MALQRRGTCPLGAVIFIAMRSRFTAGAVGASDEGCCGGTCCEDKHSYAVSDSAEPKASKGLERDGGRAKLRWALQGMNGLVIGQLLTAGGSCGCPWCGGMCMYGICAPICTQQWRLQWRRPLTSSAWVLTVAPSQRHSGTAAQRGAMSAAGSVGGSPQVYPDRSVRTPAGADSG
jgi:hypothetical protein